MNKNQAMARRRMLGYLGAIGMQSTLPALAQSDYPNRPIRIVLGLPAGGAADIVVRALAQELEQTLKQPVLVDNKPGGLFQIAVQAVASAPADGHTLLYINSSFVTVQAVQKKFDLARQFQPLTLTGETPSVLVVNTNSRFKTMKDLVEFGRTRPNELSYGTLGIGTLEHLKSVQLTEAAGIDAKAIPYKGGPDMLNAVIAGDIHFTGVNVFSALPFIKSGKLRPLAALDSARIKSLPDTPTIIEAGVNTSTTRIWSGFAVHQATPAPIVQRLFTELVAAMNSPEIVKKYSPLGILTTTSKSPEDFRSFINSEAAWMGVASKKIDLLNN